MPDSIAEQEKPGATPYDDYIPGSKDPDGHVIKTVVGRHRNFVVYITDNDGVGWNYDVLPERLRPAIAEFQVLTGLRSSLPPKCRSQCTVHLASSLYGALLADEKSDPLSSFRTARIFLETKARERARLNYVVISTAFALLVFGFFLTIRYFIPDENILWIAVTKGLAGGTIGALTSIILRGHDIGVDPLASASDLAMQGMLRVILGSIFGGLIVISSLANLAFGDLQRNPVGLLLLTVVAGFSERLVPDLMEKAAGSSNGSSASYNPGVATDN